MADLETMRDIEPPDIAEAIRPLYRCTADGCYRVATSKWTGKFLIVLKGPANTARKL
jgi:hypothetical protein